MTVTLGQIQEFLEKKVPKALDDDPVQASEKAQHLVSDGIQVAESFLSRIVDGRYTFRKHEEIDDEWVRRSLVPALGGQPPSKVTFIRMARPFVKPDFMTEEAYYTMGAQAVALCVDKWLHRLLDDTWSERRFNLWPRSDLLSSPVRALYTGVVDASSLANPVFLAEPGILPNFHANYDRAVTYLYTFLLAGDQSAVSRLKGLLNLMAKCMPLGEKKGEPGHWLVLKP